MLSLPLFFSQGLFIGREDEVERLVSLYESQKRLVTLVGPGGIGKTRLAAHFLERQQADQKRYSRLLCCDVTSVTDEVELNHVVAVAIGATLGSDSQRKNDLDSLGSTLCAFGPTLFLLDGAEAAVSVIAKAAVRWLDLAPQCDVLVTSREPLHVAGEQVIRLMSLSLEDSRKLFAARVRESGNADATQDFNSPDADAVIEKLDGNPLSIELAAGRAGLLSVAQFRDMTATSLSVLTSPRRDLPPRHASLRDSIAASWKLLDSEERSLMAHCSLFSGAFTLSSAQALTGFSANHTVEVISRLYDKSLLNTDDSLDERCYFMRDSVREFARARLEEFGARDDSEARHADYFAELAKEHGKAIGGHLTARAIQRLDLATVDITRAVHWLATRDLDRAADAAFGLGEALAFRPVAAALTGLLAPVVQEAENAGRDDLLVRVRILEASVFERLNNLGSAEAAIERAKQYLARSFSPLADLELVALSAYIYRVRGRLAGAEQLYRQVEVSTEASDGAGGEPRDVDAVVERRKLQLRGRAMLGQALIKYMRREDGAMERLNHALSLSRTSNDVRTEALALLARGHVLRASGLPDEAKTQFIKARDTAAAIGVQSAQAYALLAIGNLAYDTGAFDEAEKHWERAFVLFVQSGDAAGPPAVRRHQALLAHERGSLTDAWLHRDDALWALQEAGFSPSPLFSVLRGEQGLVALERGRFKAADELLDSALRALSDCGDERYTAILQGFSALSKWAGGQNAVALQALGLAQARLQQKAPNESETATLDILGRILRDEVVDEPPQQAGWPVRLVHRIASRIRSQHSQALGANKTEIRLQEEAQKNELLVSSDTSVFELHGRKVSLQRRASLRRVLAGLVTLRQQAPGKALTVQDLFEMGWPGEAEQTRQEAAAQRVYWAIGTLRRLGLEECLVTNEKGYFLDTKTSLRLV